MEEAAAEAAGPPWLATVPAAAARPQGAAATPRAPPAGAERELEPTAAAARAPGPAQAAARAPGPAAAARAPELVESVVEKQLEPGMVMVAVEKELESVVAGWAPAPAARSLAVAVEN